VIQAHQLTSLRHATHICVNSQSTAVDLEGMGVAADKITVTLLGHDRIVPGDLPPGTPPDPYVLLVGEVHPRKGIPVALAAVAEISGLHVIHAGPPGPASNEVAGVIASRDLGDRVHMLGRVTDEQLAALYRHATVFCSASLAEGFGLPVLEAMAAGTAVIASDVPASREVGGDALLFTPPGDVAALTTALQTVVNDADLRARLGRDGRARAAGFSWAATAEATAAVYESILRRSHTR
jgi:glycosyltransferase involved in cell wall biosynthesis